MLSAKNTICKWQLVGACTHAAGHSNGGMPRCLMLLRVVPNQEIKWEVTGTTPEQCYARAAGRHIDIWSSISLLISVLLQASVWAIHQRFWWIRAIHPAVFLVIGPSQCCRLGNWSLSMLLGCYWSLSMLLGCYLSLSMLLGCYLSKIIAREL